MGRDEITKGFFERLRDSFVDLEHKELDEIEVNAGVEVAARIIAHLVTLNPDAKRQFEERFNTLNV